MISAHFVHNFAELGAIVGELFALLIAELDSVSRVHLILVLVVVYLHAFIAEYLKPSDLIALKICDYCVVLLLQGLVNFSYQLLFFFCDANNAVDIFLVLGARLSLILLINTVKLLAHLLGVHLVVICALSQNLVAVLCAYRRVFILNHLAPDLANLFLLFVADVLHLALVNDFEHWICLGYH